MANKLNYTGIKQYNMEQLAMRGDVPSLYQSYVEATKGNENNLHLQYWYKRVIKRNGAEEYEERELVFVEPRLNSLLYDLIDEFANNEAVTVGDRQDGHKFSAKMSTQVFERDEIELMLVRYITQFHLGVMKYVSDTGNVLTVKTKPIEDFMGNDDAHSNNKLIRYILDSFRKRVMIEMLNDKFDVVRFQQNGVKYYVKQQIEVVNFDDTLVSEDEEGGAITLADVIADSNDPIADLIDDKSKGYKLRAEGEYIHNNYLNVMTNHQAKLIGKLVDDVMSGQIDVQELFHDVTGEIKVEALGRAIYSDKGNSRLQKDTRELIKSIRNRMEKQLNKQGRTLYDDKPEVRSTFARFPQLSMEDNKMWADYDVESKIKRKFDWEDNPIYANVRKFDDDRVVEQSDVEKVEQKIMTVQQLIDKYGLSRVESDQGGYIDVGNLKLEKGKMSI